MSLLDLIISEGKARQSRSQGSGSGGETPEADKEAAP